MENNRATAKYVTDSAIADAQREFLTKVYSWMVGALLLTAGAAWYTFMNNWDLALINSGIYWGVIIAQFGVVIWLSGWVERMQKNTAIMAFLGYSLLTGVTFSVILRAFTSESIYTVFLITAGMFAALSFYGFTAKKDLSGVGKFMFMGLVGIIIATIVNFFILSSAMHFVISCVGVVVFAGLTAYDTQKLKEMYSVMAEGDEMATKFAIRGALALYLDFINLFLFLLRLFGGSRD